MNKNIIFMGTPLIASEYLNTLLKNELNIVAVFTQPPKKKSRGMKLSKSPVHITAIKKNINVFHPQNFDKQTIDQLKKLQPDLIVVAAYGKLLPREVLNLPKYGCINIHLSLLPRWRGAAPIEYTLMNGDDETGVSIIKLTERLDSGPIISQTKFKVGNNINKLHLTKKLIDSGNILLTKTISSIFNNDITPKAQNDKYATFAKKINSQDRKINFHKSMTDIINLVRAHSPKPGAWFTLNNERIKIIDVKAGIDNGSVSTILNNKFEIACIDGSVEPLKLQREGKEILTKDEFLRGFKFKINDIVND